jgi:hypothetical protein
LQDARTKHLVFVVVELMLGFILFMNKRISLVVAVVVTAFAMAPDLGYTKEAADKPSVTMKHGKFAGVVRRSAQKQDSQIVNAPSVVVKHGKFAGVVRRAQRNQNAYASSN